MISVARLIAAGIAPTQARDFSEPLEAACVRFKIHTPARLGALIGQCRVESANFTQLEESLFYRSPERIQRIFPSRVSSLQDAARLVGNPKALANRVYANKNGNGDEFTGDGWRFHGRGLIQLTGKTNYEEAAKGLGVDYLTVPELVARPIDACLTAAWFWASHGLNELADGWALNAITKKVNGSAMLHADLRQQYSEEAVKAFS